MLGVLVVYPRTNLGAMAHTKVRDFSPRYLKQKSPSRLPCALVSSRRTHHFVMDRIVQCDPVD